MDINDSSRDRGRWSFFRDRFGLWIHCGRLRRPASMPGVCLRGRTPAFADLPARGADSSNRNMAPWCILEGSATKTHTKSTSPHQWHDAMARPESVFYAEVWTDRRETSIPRRSQQRSDEARGQKRSLCGFCGCEKRSDKARQAMCDTTVQHTEPHASLTRVSPAATFHDRD